MIKTKTIIRRVTKDGKTRTFLSETIRKILFSTRRYLSDLIFGLALSSGVTPKKFAKNLSKERVEKFGRQLSEELGKEAETQTKKEKKSLESTGATVKLKRGRPRKDAK